MTPTLPPGFPTELAPLATEIHTYFRVLPQLLAEGEEGRFAVVKGAEVFGTWDTQKDAIQYGHERVPDGQFLAQEIDARFLTAFGAFFQPPAASGTA